MHWQRLQLPVHQLSDWIRSVGKPWTSGLPADFQMASSAGFGWATRGHSGICSKAGTWSWMCVRGVAGRWIFARLCGVFSSRTCLSLAPFIWWCHDGAVVWCSGIRWWPGNEHHLDSAGLNALAFRPENYISVSLDLRKHCLLKSRWVAICLFAPERRMALRWCAVES